MSEFDAGLVEDESNDNAHEFEYTPEYVANRLEELSDVAYGWHINGKVVGIPVVEFERLLDKAAEIIRQKLT